MIISFQFWWNWFELNQLENMCLIKKRTKKQLIIFIKIVCFNTKMRMRTFTYVTCSWHQKNATTNSPIYQFKVLQNVFKMKSKAWNVFKEINKKLHTVKKQCQKTRWPLSCTLNSWIGELENSWFRFLMSRTG